MEWRAELRNIGHWLVRNSPWIAYMVVWVILIIALMKLLVSIGNIEDQAIRLIALMIFLVLFLNIPRVPRLVEDRFSSLVRRDNRHY